ncbi:MAG: DUF4190 domain-containing protein [Pyrinomonadaceae bacterium]
MKKCPTCGKTFDDNMRFCQVDGTPLVDDVQEAAPDAPAAAAAPPPAAPVPPAAPEPAAEEPEFDPYATIVGVPRSVIPPSTPPEASIEPPTSPPTGEVVLEPLPEAGPSSSADAGPVAGESGSSVPVAPPDDILDLGENDPLKTMYVSDAEMKEVLGTTGQGAETPSEEIRADEARTAGSQPSGGTDFGSISPPPSPFSAAPRAPEDSPVPEPPGFLETPEPSITEAKTQVQERPPFEPPPPYQPEPSFQDAPTMYQSEPEPPQFSSPPPAPVQSQEWNPPPAPIQNQEWNPPPAPAPEWQNQQIGSNTPFQPPPAGAGGQNKTLAIVSLVLGILSICCYVGPVTGIAALITGYLANKKANQDPQTYGGKGLALAGMILGGVFFAVGVAYYIYLIVIFGLIASGNVR